MSKRRSFRALVVILLAGAAALAAAAVSRQSSGRPLPLKLVANVPLPGPSNRFDYTSLDPTLGRLYFAHMDAGQLLVKLGQGELAPKAHAVAVDPRTHLVFRSNAVKADALNCES